MSFVYVFEFYGKVLDPYFQDYRTAFVSWLKGVFQGSVNV